MSFLLKIVCITLLLSSCSSNTEIDGVWAINDSAYSATYEIKNFGDKKKALILKYDDGTTRFNIKDKKIFVFNNLKERNGEFIDAVSGATKANSSVNKIKRLHEDTLEVTTYLMNKPVKENWIRTTK